MFRITILKSLSNLCYRLYLRFTIWICLHNFNQFIQLSTCLIFANSFYFKFKIFYANWWKWKVHVHSCIDNGQDNGAVQSNCVFLSVTTLQTFVSIVMRFFKMVLVSLLKHVYIYVYIPDLDVLSMKQLPSFDCRHYFNTFKHLTSCFSAHCWYSRVTFRLVVCLFYSFNLHIPWSVQFYIYLNTRENKIN